MSKRAPIKVPTVYTLYSVWTASLIFASILTPQLVIATNETCLLEYQPTRVPEYFLFILSVSKSLLFPKSQSLLQLGPGGCISNKKEKKIRSGVCCITFGTVCEIRVTTDPRYGLRRSFYQPVVFRSRRGQASHYITCRIQTAFGVLDGIFSSVLFTFVLRHEGGRARNRTE